MDFPNDKNLTIAELSPLLRRGKISPVELTEALLERIRCLEPELNAFITVTAGEARKQARRAERELRKREWRGPLHGIPITLKDLFYTAGIRTTAASKILRNFVPAENAAAADRLYEAGAILLGKTNLHEFAYGVTSINPHFGPVRNPWDVRRIPGGSSGGSAAAVAAGMCVASMGTDTGGSIRIPSAACGVVGLKPTRGLVSLAGVIPLSQTLDHAGPICRCVEDAALMLEAVEGERGSRAKSHAYTRRLKEGIGGIRVGIPRQYFFDRVRKEVKYFVLSACGELAGQGARLREVDMKGMPEAGHAVGVITVAEALAYHWNWFQKRPGDYGPDVRARLESNRDQRSVEYLQARQKRRAYTEAVEAVFQSVDVLAVPTLPVLPPLIEEKEVQWGRATEDVRPALLRFT
ncbi:MAG TPA: amidase, partial [Thermodesulfobacteriota bacterium]|nr:amidase [Thermodesulfobacteriota bacterium]